MTSTGEETETVRDEQDEDSPVTSLLEARKNLVAGAERADEKTTHQHHEAAHAAADRKPAEVSASTIARMMGIVTSAEFKLFETKLELISTKLTTLSSKLDKAVSQLTDVAGASDLERIDVQIAALRTLIKETLERQLTGESSEKKRKIVSNKT